MEPYLISGDVSHKLTDPNIPKWIHEYNDQVKPIPKNHSKSINAKLEVIKELQNKLKPIQNKISDLISEVKKECRHPLKYRRFVYTSRENEFDTGFIKSKSYIWCCECERKIAETEPI
jgi:hypothetical protein